MYVCMYSSAFEHVYTVVRYLYIIPIILYCMVWYVTEAKALFFLGEYKKEAHDHHASDKVYFQVRCIRNQQKETSAKEGEE